MYSVEYLQNKINKTLEGQDFHLPPPELYMPVQYALTQGGKRMRPVLTLMAYNLYHENVDKAVPAALAFEIFHNFTLVHDDIMDNSPLRRGKETVFRKWGSNTAILAGDTMFALAYEYLLHLEPGILAQVLAVFNKTAIQVCEGQQLDMNFETREDVTIEDYLEMIRLKTAVLLGGSLKTGAVCARAPESDAEALYHFGENMGLAFQIMDDCLDVFGDEEKFGKKPGSDILARKKNFLYLKAIELTDNQERMELIRNIYASGIEPEDRVDAVVAMYKKLNIDAVSEKEMGAYYQAALRHLDQVGVAPERKILLRSFAERLLKRES